MKYQSTTSTIRTLLKEFSDGLSPKDISEKSGIDRNQLYRALKKMPDAYIDRWVHLYDSGHPTAIWCLVDVPKDCPKPRRVKREY